MINNNEIINGERKSPLIWLILFVSHPIALFFEIWKQFLNPFFARGFIQIAKERERERQLYCFLRMIKNGNRCDENDNWPIKIGYNMHSFLPSFYLHTGATY